MTGKEKWTSLVALGLAMAWGVSPFGLHPSAAQDSPTLAQPQPAQQEARRADFVADSGDDSEESERDNPSVEEPDDQSPAPQSGISAATPESQNIQRPADDADMDDSEDAATTPVEVIKERYPDTSIKIEREVTQDAQGNYVNHGAWKMFDQHGNPVAQGEYRYGNRSGTWIRWYRNPSEAPLLTTSVFRQYNGPFISQASFEHGQLHGSWMIYDGKKHKISQWDFADGHRQGPSTWWYPSGKKMREIQYREGEIDGQLMEWNPEGAVTLNQTYHEGRKLAPKAATYPNGSKKSQGMFLFAKDIEKTPDDWWNCKLMETTKAGKDEKHGTWTSWHQNGQHQLEGNYDHDLQTGVFTWWHTNGQKALEGRFDNGKQDGEWTWWFANGQKSIHGEYAHGNPTGRWTWWKEDGRVAQSADLSHSEGVVIDTPPPAPNEPAPIPQVRKPTSRGAGMR
ncbi:MAG TPA: hypothetical protein VHV08_11000 [Pirellulales bacterium]|nr:hypothetical protein [Pirellulales bacterium]